ncbi:hypothetical protein Hdeb2414_s0037g00733481 [Helianthus debilis subsp. tardiflorus]
MQHPSSCLLTSSLDYTCTNKTKIYDQQTHLILSTLQISEQKKENTEKPNTPGLLSLSGAFSGGEPAPIEAPASHTHTGNPPLTFCVPPIYTPTPFLILKRTTTTTNRWWCGGDRTEERERGRRERGGEKREKAEKSEITGGRCH